MRTALSLFLLLKLPLTSGYVTSYAVIPQNKQIKWLKKLTGDICNSPAGQLTDDMIEAAPEIMKGWTSWKHPNTENALAVEALLKRLVDESKAGNPKALPTTFDYNCLLEIWARSGAGAFAAERCEQILMEMEERHHKGNSKVQPNLSSFKAVLMAWRQSGESYSPHRAQRVLNWMVRLHAEGKNDLVLPDSDCFDIVLQSWSQSQQRSAPRQAEKLLGKMETLSRETSSPKLRPNTLSFNAVLNAWAKSKENRAWLRVLDVLSFMEYLYYREGNTRVRPDSATYNIVMSCLARSGDEGSAPKADAILKRIELEYKAGNLGWAPGTILFNCAMGCWTKSRSSGAYRRARSLLDRQINIFEGGCEESRPDVFGFTSVLSSCASEPGSFEEKGKAFNVALATFQLLVSRSDEFGTPNHVTYGTMLKACSRLLPYGSPIRQKWTRRLFEDCKREGQVGDMVLSRLREAATPDEYKEMMEGHSKRHPPAQWRRNVSETNDYRHKVIASRRRAEL